MEAMGMMRDLDQIRERDDAKESSRIALIALGGLATACVLFAVGVMIGRESEGTRPARRDDPLARLDALAGQGADSGSSAAATSYTDRLIDTRAATSAQGAGGSDPSADPTAATLAGPSGSVPAASHEAVRASAEVPASALVEPSGRVRDALPSAAHVPTPSAIRIVPAATTPTSPAQAGSDGTFTLQVSSFRALAGAQTFAQRLRERGHRAFVSTSPAGQNGVWHRVRVGPFPSLRDAGHYREQFEARERLPTFVVRRDEAGSVSH